MNKLWLWLTDGHYRRFGHIATWTKWQHGTVTMINALGNHSYECDASQRECTICGFRELNVR